MADSKKKNILYEFLNSHNFNIDMEDISNYWRRDTPFYQKYYNLMGVSSDEEDGRIRYTYNVDNSLSAVIQTIHIHRQGTGWDYIDTMIYPLNQESILLLDKGLSDEIREKMKKGIYTHYVYEKKEHMWGWTDYKHKYRISLCGNYVIKNTYYDYYGQEDPDNLYQQIQQSGWEEPVVYRFAD